MSTQRALSSLARLTPRSDSWWLRAKGNCRAKAAQRLETASWWPTVNHVYKRSNAKTLEKAPAVLPQIFPSCFFFSAPCHELHLLTTTIPLPTKHGSLNQSFSSSCSCRRCQAATYSSSCLVRFVLEAMALGESRLLKKLWCICSFFFETLQLDLAKFYKFCLVATFVSLKGFYKLNTLVIFPSFFFSAAAHTHKIVERSGIGTTSPSTLCWFDYHTGPKAELAEPLLSPKNNNTEATSFDWFI